MIAYTLTNLTNEERKILKNLTESVGWEIVKKIEENQRHQLGDAMIRLNLGDAEQVEDLRIMQFYASGRADFVKAIENNAICDDSEIIEDGTTFESMEKILLNQE